MDDVRRQQRASAERAHRRARVAGRAARQAGVISRRQVLALGVTRAEIRANVSAARWQRVGRHVLAMTTGVLTLEAELWAAQLSGGPRAQLDGASALIAAGLTGFDVRRHRVSVPRGARVFRDGLVDVRQTRRWSASDLAPTGPPRTRPEVAAVRAALWAASPRQAALVLSMVVQQRIAPAELIAHELLRIKRAPRLSLLHDVVGDLLDGAHSLSELDFARECRRRGLPRPTRQAVRRGRDGRYYLDVLWEEWDVAVEIDGIHHTWAAALIDDALRHNEVTLQHAVVLRLPVLGLRVAPDDFFEQISRALRSRGWSGADPSRAPAVRHAKANG